MITCGLSCDRVEFGHFGGGSDDPLDPPLATGLLSLSPSVSCCVYGFPSPRLNLIVINQVTNRISDDHSPFLSLSPSLPLCWKSCILIHNNLYLIVFNQVITMASMIMKSHFHFILPFSCPPLGLL